MRGGANEAAAESEAAAHTAATLRRPAAGHVRVTRAWAVAGPAPPAACAGRGRRGRRLGRPTVPRGRCAAGSTGSRLWAGGGLSPPTRQAARQLRSCVLLARAAVRAAAFPPLRAGVRAALEAAADLQGGGVVLHVPAVNRDRFGVR